MLFEGREPPQNCQFIYLVVLIGNKNCQLVYIYTTLFHKCYRVPTLFFTAEPEPVCRKFRSLLLSFVPSEIKIFLLFAFWNIIILYTLVIQI